MRNCCKIYFYNAIFFSRLNNNKTNAPADAFCLQQQMATWQPSDSENYEFAQQRAISTRK